MSFNHNNLVLAFCHLILFFHRSDAFNITQILENYPKFSDFNDYLVQTNLKQTIEAQGTVTVFAVANDNLSPLSAKSPQQTSDILSVHVVLDYYDLPKLRSLPNKTMKLITLFQRSGRANGEQGFLNATDLKDGSVAIASSVPGSTQGATMLGSVAQSPYNISVLEISNLIIPTGIGSAPAKGMGPTLAPTQAPPPLKARAPVRSYPVMSPPAPAPDGPAADAPAPAGEPAPSPADEPSPADDPEKAAGDALRYSPLLVASSAVFWLASMF